MKTNVSMAKKFKKGGGKKTSSRLLSELTFWKHIALQQQAILHAKNRT